MAGSNRLPGTQEAEKLSRVLGDIGNKLERVHSLSTFRFEMDFEKLEDVNKALWTQYGNFQKLHKVWPEYAENLRRLNLAQQDATKNLEKFIDEYKRLDGKKNKQGLTADELDRWDKLANDILPKAKSRVAALNDSINITDAKVKAVASSMAKWGETLVTKIAKGSLGIVTVALGTFIQTLNSGWEMQNRFRASFAGMAKQIGAFSPQLKSMQDLGQGMYFATDSLGAMGMSMDEIGSQVSGFTTGLGLLDQGMLSNTQKLVEWGTALGMSGQEAGEFARSMALMGKNGQDVEKMFQRVAAQSKKLGIPSLSKDVLVLGRNLFATFGPKFETQLTNTIAKFRQLGISVQTLEKFTESTDNFDQTAAAIARMNTAFGTHANAMEIFLENDPSKRLGMISKQLQLQGITVENIGRNERRMLAQTMGMTMDEINGILSRAGSLDKLEETLQKDDAATASLTAGLSELKTTLVATGRMFDRIMISVFKAMQPTFDALGLSFDNTGSALQRVGNLALAFEQKMVGVFDAVGKGPAKEAFKTLGTTLKELGTKFMEFISSEKFPIFLTSLTNAVAAIGKMVAAFVSLFSNDLVLSGLTFMADHFGKILIAVAGIKAAMFGMQIVNLGRTLSGAAGAAGAAGSGAGIGGGLAAAAGGAATFAGKAGKAILGKGVGGAAGGLVGGLAGAGISSAMGMDNGIGGAIGGLIGGGLGLLAPFPGGALIGSALGTVAGNWIESKFAKSDASVSAASSPQAAASPLEGNTNEAAASATTQATAGALKKDVLEPLTLNIQVLLDGNMIQEQVMRQELRRQI